MAEVIVEGGDTEVVEVSIGLRGLKGEKGDGVTAIVDLSDVDLTDIADGHYMYWNTDTFVTRMSLVLGVGANDAFAGDVGQIAYEHSQTLHDKAFVGLGNVENLSPADLPLSDADAVALALKLDVSLKGANSGLAELNASGKVPQSQLTGSVLDIQEYPTLGDFPITGLTDILYIALDTNLGYRWTGTFYIAVPTSLALGSTADSAHRGDHGSAAYDHSQTPHDRAFVGLPNVDNTSDIDKPLSAIAKMIGAITTKADFLAEAEKRVRDNVGSGFSEWGKHNTSQEPVNEGMYGEPSVPNRFSLGRESASTIGGVSRTDFPIVTVAGVQHKVEQVDTTTPNALNVITFPPAPDGTKTYDTDTGVVVIHGSAAEAFEGEVVNGDFRDGVADWTESTPANGSFSVVNGVATMTQAGTGSYFIYQRSLAYQIGTTYRVEITAKPVNAHAWAMGTSAELGGESIQGSTDTTNFKTYTFETTATGSNGYVFLDVTQDNDAGDAIQVSSVSIMPVSEEVITSRQDFVFLESWHEAVDIDAGVIFPLGNVQFGGSTHDSIPTHTHTSQKYCAFGDWDGTTIGRHISLSTITAEEFQRIADDYEYNLYWDSEAETLVQVRYRIRVIEGLGDDWRAISPQSTQGSMQYDNVGPTTVKVRGTDTIFVDFDISNDGRNFYAVNQDDHSTKTLGEWTVHQNVSDRSHGNNLFAVPIALVQRRNEGAYHPAHNPNGTASFHLKGTSATMFWHRSELQSLPITASVCLNPITGASPTGALGYEPTVGNIGNSYRTDDKAYDAIYGADVEDQRMSSRRVPLGQIREEYKRKAIAGEVRGFEPVPFTYQFLTGGSGGFTDAGGFGLYASQGNLDTDILYYYPSDYLAGDTFRHQNGDTVTILLSNGDFLRAPIASRDDGATSLRLDISSYTGEKTVAALNCSGRSASQVGAYSVVSRPQLHSQANSTWTDIIGTPENLAITFPNGCEGTWLSTIPTGSSLEFKATRKAVSDYQREQTVVNSGVWAAHTNIDFTGANNSFTTNLAANTVYLFHYETQAHFTEDDVNSTVVDLGGVFATDSNNIAWGNILLPSLLGKVGTGSSHPYVMDVPLIAGIIDPDGELTSITDAYSPNHASLTLGYSATTPAVKVIDYLSVGDGVGKLCYAYEELAYTSGSFRPWGDDNSFTIVDNQSTQEDMNGVSTLYGTASFNTQFFIDESDI